MKSEFYEKKLQEKIRELEKISHLSFYLFSEDGSLAAGSEPENPEELRQAVRTFQNSAADSQIAYGYQFCRIIIQGELKYILLADFESMEFSSVVLQMAASQIGMLYELTHKTEDESDYFRQMLTGEMTPEEYRKKSKIDRTSAESSYMLYVLEFEQLKTEAAVATVQNMISPDETEYLLELDEQHMVIVQKAEGMLQEDVMEFSRMLIDNIQGEAMVNVRIGCGTPAEQLSLLGRSYQEACTALQVCSIFSPDTQIAVYGRLGIGQLIYQLPLNLCEQFLQEVFSHGEQEDLDEEMLLTVDRLFENNLNISETARQLYVHRNTLVYRLERIQKIIGLDLRVFEDAMLFRIAMMVQAHVDHIKSSR